MSTWTSEDDDWCSANAPTTSSSNCKRAITVRVWQSKRPSKGGRATSQLNNCVLEYNLISKIEKRQSQREDRR
jgi:hypothetical protein